MVPRNRKRVQDCDALIARLDTAYAEKQQMESRMQKLEEGNAAINSMLNKILNKLEKQ
jgi:predicted nuclease with TOPRIM domain